MSLPSTFSLAYIALWLLVPGALIAGHRLARASTRHAEIAWLVTPAYALGSTLAVLHVSATLAGSFRVGLVASLVLVGGAGYALHVLRPCDPLPPLNLRRWVAPLVGLLFGSLVVVPLALGWAFHDETQLYSHLSTAAQLQNDVYPPRYPTFPDWELRYHYMFNVLMAALSAMARLRLDVAVDLLTLAGWAYLWILLSAWGRRIADHDAGWLAAPVALLGGGFTALCTTVQEGCDFCRRVGTCGVGAEFVNAPFVSYLFQHPWSLGLPVAIALLLVASDREGPLRPARYLGWGLVGFGLAFSQMALCLATLATLVFAEFVESRDDRVRRTGWAGAALLVSLGVASQFGGFFAPSPSEGGLITWHPGITDEGLLGELRWFGASFGLLLPLGIAGIVFATRERAVLAPLAAGGVVLVLTLNWGGAKWDVLKFATISQVALGVASGVLLARAWSSAAPPRLRAAAALALALVAMCYAGPRFAAPFVAALFEPDPAIEQRFAREHPVVEGPDAEVLAWLRPQVAPGEIVFRSSFRASFAYQLWGGLSAPWTENRAMMFGFSNERLQAREALFEVRTDQFDALCAERMVWFVVHPEDPLTLRRSMATWTSDGRARIENQFGPLSVVRLDC